MGQHAALTGTDLHISRERFIKRNSGAPDFAMAAPFIGDGVLYPDQLDLSAIVPAGAIAVLLSIECPAPNSVVLFANQTTMARALVSGISPLPSTYMLPIDDTANDRLVDVQCGLGTVLCNVSVLGWWF